MEALTNQSSRDTSENILSPIVLFTYKKLIPLELTINALKNNGLASKSELFIFSDGGKSESDNKEIELVRSFINQIVGFKRVTIFESKKNIGLAKSIIDGVSKILETYSTVIVLEDDLVTSTNFLDYMNEALTNYETNTKVHSISAYTVPISSPKDYPYCNYFTKRASSWGWATWKKRWEEVDWDVEDYHDFIKDKSRQKLFNTMGSDMTGMLIKQMNGDISSWAIRWCYDQFKKDMYTVFPILSKVSNVGFGENATHTRGSDDRFSTPLDNSQNTNFKFNPKPELDAHFLKQFTEKYSLQTRAFYRIKNFLGIQ